MMYQNSNEARLQAGLPLLTDDPIRRELLMYLMELEHWREYHESMWGYDWYFDGYIPRIACGNDVRELSGLQILEV